MPLDPVQSLTGLEQVARDAARKHFERRSLTPLPISRVHQQADEAISQFQAAAKDKGVTVDCAASCDTCCHRRIAVSEFEIESICAYLRENQMAVEPPAEPYAEHAPCILLKERLCSVYTVRPIACRAKNSLSVEQCRQWLAGQRAEVEIESLGPQTQILPAVIRGLLTGANDAGKPLQRYDLGLGVAEMMTTGKLTASSQFKEVPTEETIQLEGDRPKLAELFAGVTGFTEALQQEPAAARKMLARLPHGARLVRSLQSPLVYESAAQIEEERVRIKAVFDQLTHEEYDRTEALEVLSQFAVTFEWLFHGRSDRELFEPFGQIVSERVLKPLAPWLLEPMPSNRRPGKLRLAYISPQLRNANGSRWALKLAQAHPREHIEFIALDVGPTQDHITSEWKRLADRFYRLEGPVLEMGRFIRELDLDVLIFTDVGIDGISNVLGSMRLARRQCAGWGGPWTSGLAGMDFYIAGERMLDGVNPNDFTEQLVRLPGVGVVYDRRFVPTPKKLDRKLPFEPFMMCAQSIYKCHPDWDGMYAMLTDRLNLPIAFSQSHYPAAAAKVGQRLQRSGVKAWFYPRLTEEGYAEVLMRSAASIDTPYYNGGITAIEALSMGVPIVTLPTPQMRGRFGKAFMEHVGMGDWVASSPEDYVDKALNWQAMREALAKSDVEALYEDRGVTTALNEWLLNE